MPDSPVTDGSPMPSGTEPARPEPDPADLEAVEAADLLDGVDGGLGLAVGIPAAEAEDLGAVARRARRLPRRVLRRLQAEFDNYRKRVERQQRDMIDNAATGLVKALLPVLDTADLALAHGGGEDVRQVVGALWDVLAKEGLEARFPRGPAFRPRAPRRRGARASRG